LCRGCPLQPWQHRNRIEIGRAAQRALIYPNAAASIRERVATIWV
jgi:hypothetical protein